MGGPPVGLDIAQMLERMPQTHIEGLKPGETIVVSSASNARSDRLTAILLVGNADSLLQIEEVLKRLKADDDTDYQIVLLRFYSGLDEPQSAKALVT